MIKKHILAILLLYSAITIAQEHRSEIIRSSSHFEVRGDKLFRTDSVLIQINERMGDHDTYVSYVYSKGDKVSIGNAWIEDMDGKIVRKLKSNEIEDHSYIRDAAFYSDNYIKQFQLKHNIYPYRIFYTAKVAYARFTQIGDIDYSGSEQPIREKRIIVETDIDQPLKYKSENINDPQIETLSKSMRYTWRFSYTPLKREIYASINKTNAPRITILPNNFKYGERGNWDSWQSFGDWISRLNSKKDDLPESEKNKIDNLVKGITDNKEKARILYHYLQDNNRYINVSIKTGGLETHPASYVCANRYGDCKALSNYMKTALDYIGIKSYYTIIYSDERVSGIDPDFPSNAFNHAILTVPFGSDTTYLECTNKVLPFGYIHSGIQGRKALLVDEDNSHLVNIPAQKPEDVLCIRSFDVDNLSGNASIILKTDQKGSHFERSTDLSTRVNKNSVDKYMRNTILSGSYELQDFKFDKKDRDTDNIRIEATIKMNNVMKKYGNNILLSPFPLDISLYEKPEERKQHLQLDMPEYYIDTIRYQLPSSESIAKIPSNVNIDSPYGKYSLEFEIKDNILTVTKSLLILSGRYDLKDYKEFYKYIIAVKNYENQKYNVEIL